MPALKYDLKPEQGASFSFSVTRKDKTGNPIDLTGYSARMQIRQTQGASVLVEASTDNGKITIPVGTDGKILVKLSATDTTKLKYSKCVYDLKAFIGSDGANDLRILQGNVLVSPAITQEPGDPVVIRV